MSGITQRSGTSGGGGPEQMFPLRLTSPVPTQPIGKDVSLMGIAEDGKFYYCKTDDEFRLVRASEEVFTRLARDLGIPTAAHNIIEDHAGETFFGSQCHPSTAGEGAVASYFRLPATNELGGPDRSKAVLIGRLYVFDMFIGNPDRSLRNMLAIHEGGYQRIAAIDFAEANLLLEPRSHFPDPLSATVRWQRLLDNTHAFAHEAAEEMLTRIDAVPVSFFEPIFERMQAGWMGDAQQRSFLEFWCGDQRRDRVAALGAGLRDGTLR